jgi:hypothetical protein
VRLERDDPDRDAVERERVPEALARLVVCERDRLVERLERVRRVVAR